MDKNRIYKLEFDNLLKTIPDISPEERAYLDKIFANDLVDGLTAWEIKQKMDKLEQDREDDLDHWELKKVKEKLLARLGKGA